MEQHRTSQPQGRRRPQTPVTPPVTPPTALAEGSTVYRVTGRTRRGPGGARVERAGAPGVTGGPSARRPVPPVVLALRRLPQPRLTGLGAGLFAAAVMLTLGFLDRLLLDGSPVVYGLLFLPVSALTALWVRTADLVTAPIGVPIAFAVGVVPIAGGTGGFGGQAMAVVTALAVRMRLALRRDPRRRAHRERAQGAGDGPTPAPRPVVRLRYGRAGQGRRDHQGGGEVRGLRARRGALRGR